MECKYCTKVQNILMFRKNRKKCLNCERADGRKYRQSELGKIKAKTWSDNNKEHHAKLQSDWAKNNRDHINAKYNERMKTDFCFKMIKTCQTHLRNNIKKKYSTMKYFSCDIDLFVKWMEYCFADGMTMENHGLCWHLDHVIPVTLFDLENQEELRLCFHYLNYMPLLAKDNISKQNKILVPQLIKHKENILNFHKENNLKIDEEYLKLLARHLTKTGISLEF